MVESEKNTYNTVRNNVMCIFYFQYPQRCKSIKWLCKSQDQQRQKQFLSISVA